MIPPKDPNGKYHADFYAQPWALDNVSDEQLKKWATDPNCIEMEICSHALEERLDNREKDQADRAARREQLQENPFDPRTEVSADAKHIARKVVTHLWIIFVLLPFVAAILWALLK